MQVILNVPNVIPQEIVNKLLKQWNKQLQAEEILALNLQNSNNTTTKARLDLTQMIHKLRDSAEELGIVSEDEISVWVNEDRTKNAHNY